MKYLKYLALLLLVFMFYGCTKTNNEENIEMPEITISKEVNFYAYVEVEAKASLTPKNAQYGFIIGKGIVTKEELLEKSDIVYSDGITSEQTFYLELKDNIEYDKDYTILALCKVDDKVSSSDTFTLNIRQEAIKRKEASGYVKNMLVESIYRQYLNETEITIEFDLDGGTIEGNIPTYYIGKGTSLPTPTKDGYTFLGYKFSNDDQTRMSYPGFNYYIEKITLTAMWEVEPITRVNLRKIMEPIPNTLENDFELLLPDSDKDCKFSWQTSNSKLVTFLLSNCTFKEENKTHNIQKVTITLMATYTDGYIDMYEKEITIKPIYFNDLPATPFGSYFQTSAAETYRAQNKYYQETKNYFSPTAIEALDIVYYAFITLNEFGGVQLSDVSMANTLVKLRKQGIRIIGSIAGVSGSTSKYFANLTSDEEKCKKFVNNLMDLAEKYHFDGLDIDWESTSEQYVVASGMNRLARLLREEMDNRTYPGATPYMLTAAVPASSWGLGADRYDFPTLNNYLDYINIMSYDANKSNVASHIDPFYISSYDNGYGFGVMYGIDNLVRLGFPKSKLMAGLAGYGKAYKINGTINQSAQYPALGMSATLIQIPGLVGSYATGTVFGGAVCELMEKPEYIKYTEYNRQGNLVASYLVNFEESIFITYEDSMVIREKYTYCAGTDGLGLMCWAYTEDTQNIVVDTIAEMRGPSA